MEENYFFLTLVRHGETDPNRNHVILTYSDAPLNELGQKQAQLLGQHLAEEKFKVIYSSDLIRAYDTAKSVQDQSKHEMEIISDKRIQERNFKDMEGLPNTSWQTDAIAWAAKVKKSMLLFDPPGVESYAEFTSRIKEFFEELLSRQEKEGKSGDHILITSHGLWIFGLFDFLKCNFPFEILNKDGTRRSEFVAGDYVMDNTGISRLRIQLSEGKWKIELLSINDTDHLATLKASK